MIIYETACEPFVCSCGRKVHRGDRQGTVDGRLVCQRCADDRCRRDVDKVLLGADHPEGVAAE
jgi:hypothetical protein